MLKRKFLCALLTLCLTSLLSGCVLVPIINGVKEMGVTKEDRARLFDKAISDFHDYQRMQMQSEIAPFIVPEYRNEFMNIFRSRRNSEKIVDYAIDMVEFNDSVDEAIVEAAVRNFKLNRYIVETRMEKQHWVFQSSTWRLKKLEIMPEQQQ